MATNNATNGVDYIGLLESLNIPPTFGEARHSIQSAVSMLTAILKGSWCGVVPANTLRHEFVQSAFPSGVPTEESAPILFIQEGTNVWVASNAPTADLGFGTPIAGTGTAWHKLGSSSGIPVGVIDWWGGPESTIPTNALVCDGRELTISSYTALFYAIGYTQNDGRTPTSGKFYIPNLKGRTLTGADNLGGTSENVMVRAAADTLGSRTGTEYHTLTIAEMPAHNHDVQNVSSTGGTRGIPGGTDGGTNTTAIASKGGGGSHENISPTLIAVPIIYYM